MPIPKIYKIAFLLLTLLSVQPSLVTAKTAMSNQEKYQLLLQIRSAKKEIDKADSEMIQQLNLVLKRLKSYIGDNENRNRGYGVLPTEESEILKLSNYLSNKYFKNPYRRVLKNRNTSESNNPAVIVKLDATLTQNTLAQYRQHPPKTWVEKPGSIVMLHNGYNFALLWAAGVKGTPVMENGFNRAKIKSLKLNL